jgi:uncharacterized protein
MGRAIFLIFIAVLFVFLDVYSYYGLSSVLGQERNSKLFKYTYFVLSALCYFCIAYIFYYFISGGSHFQRTSWFNLASGFIFTMLVTKLVFSSIMLVQDGGRILVASLRYLQSLFSPENDVSMVFLPERRQFITTAGTFIAGIPFFTMLYGITKGKYQYTVQKISITFKDLPKAFDGFRIVQISDIHAGSFDSKAKVLSGIEKINELDADIVCMTGDLVNSQKEEIDPYVDIFSQIKAKQGKFAILGNHDYYGAYEKADPNGEKKYYEDFFSKFSAMGFDLLNNENRIIEKDGQSIQLIGVENWGAGRWFPKRGDLDVATQGIPENGFKVLMSHDPTHWDEKVKHFAKKIHLTLSGHTHGFQFGFQMPGFQWSPAKYRYKKWLGLYEEDNKFLYVNRGFGFLGFPGRVGMWPEITLIELKSEPLS